MCVCVCLCACVYSRTTCCCMGGYGSHIKLCCLVTEPKCSLDSLLRALVLTQCLCGYLCTAVVCEEVESV